MIKYQYAQKCMKLRLFADTSVVVAYAYFLKERISYADSSM